MIGVPEMALMLTLVVVPIGCLTNWYAGLQRMSTGQLLVPHRQRDTVPWGLLDLGVIVVLVALVAGLGVGMVQKWAGVDPTQTMAEMSPGDQSTSFLAFGSGTLLATLLACVWLAIRFPAAGLTHAFNVRQLGGDLELGLRWFMMLMVPVAGLQFVLTRWFPTKHPLIEMLKESGDLSFLPVAAFAAVIAAPIFEEVFFRMFLQGWLEKVQITRRRTSLGDTNQVDRDAVLLGGSTSSEWRHGSEHANDLKPSGDAATEPGDAKLVSVTSELSGENPYTASTREADAGTLAAEPTKLVGDAESNSAARPVLWLPILVSSGLFALAHFSHGPDWIPLFFLALGLGYLYQRTGRIQACIVVHFFVNLLGILQLWAFLRQV